MKHLVLCLALLAGGAPAGAAMRTVTLSVPGMSCPTCPITVKKALSRVPGVISVHSSLERKHSTVTYDDSKANVDDLTMATEEAGYPSSEVKAATP